MYAATSTLRVVARPPEFSAPSGVTVAVGRAVAVGLAVAVGRATLGGRRAQWAARAGQATPLFTQPGPRHVTRPQWPVTAASDRHIWASRGVGRAIPSVSGSMDSGGSALRFPRRGETNKSRGTALAHREVVPCPIPPRASLNSLRLSRITKKSTAGKERFFAVQICPERLRTKIAIISDRLHR
jgi:hypothetical protein